MRILQICTNFKAGGIQRHILDLSQWLRGRNHEITFAGSADEWINPRNEEAFLDLPLYGVSAGGGNLALRMAKAVKCAHVLRTYLKSNPIDIIHAHETAPALVARLATFGLDIPIVFTFHGCEPERLPEVARIAKYCADHVITPSRNCAEMLSLFAQFPEDKVQVLGLGVKHPPHLENEDEISEIRGELLGSEGNILVTSLARLDHQKGIDILIDVVAMIAAQNPNVRFVVAGDGPQHATVRVWARKKGIEKYIRFIGNTDRPYQLLNASDIFLLSSRWEALPISIVEAFRCGKPVIATDCGGVSELVDEDVGHILRVGDIEGLASAVLELSKDEDKRKRLGQNALMRSAEPRFCPDHVHAAFEKFYSEILEHRARRDSTPQRQLTASGRRASWVINKVVQRTK